MGCRISAKSKFAASTIQELIHKSAKSPKTIKEGILNSFDFIISGLECSMLIWSDATV